MSLTKDILETIYPSSIKCVVCDDELPYATRYQLCDHCKLSFNTAFCLRCGRPMHVTNQYCYTCYDNAMHFTQARSAFVFKDSVRELVHRFKYNNARYLAPTMAESMTDVYFETDWNPDCITFVPLHAKRMRKRGYNQAQLLAEELAKRIHLPSMPLLTKTKFTKNMARLSRKQREECIRDSFAFTRPSEANLAGKKILLVDDVLTTGATTNACAQVLKNEGCSEIYVLTFASVKIITPLV